MRTIEEVVEEIKSIYPNYVNPIMGDDDSKRLHDRLNEILEIHKAEKRPKGEWLSYEVKLPDRTILNYKCSVCGRKLIGYGTETLTEAPYCHCGADMRESEEK